MKSLARRPAQISSTRAVAPLIFATRADAHFSARFDQTFPTRRSKPFEKEKLDLAIIGKSSRAHHARVVQDEQIARREKFAQLGELPMFDSLLAPMQHHHAGIVPARERSLRDQLFGQHVIVIGK